MRPITWEYHLEPARSLNQARLDELGRAGWELVAFAPGKDEAIFKRPGPDFREQITLDQRAEVERGEREIPR